MRFTCDCTGWGDDSVYCKAVGVRNYRWRSFFCPEGQLTAKMSRLKHKKGKEASLKPGDPKLPFEANMFNFVSIHTEYFHNALFTF